MPDLHIRLHKDILWLILDRPPLNPLTVGMLEQLTRAIEKALRHPPRLIVITGMGERAFCVGVDLPADDSNHYAALARVAKGTDDAFKQLSAHAIPTVAVVKGNAFGAGCELVSFCDTVIARDDARFRLPAINAKVFPSATATNFPAILGREQTTRLIQSGETLSARDAFHLGLVHQVLPARHFLADTEELLVMLAAVGTHS